MRFHNICNELWNVIADILHNKRPSNFPIPVTDKASLLEWLEGFLYATACLPDDRQILAKDKEASSLLVLIFSMYEKYKEDRDVNLDKDDIIWLTKSIVYTYNFFLSLRMEHNFRSNNFYDSVELSTTKKIERNEPCPCR